MNGINTCTQKTVVLEKRWGLKSSGIDRKKYLGCWQLTWWSSNLNYWNVPLILSAVLNFIVNSRSTFNVCLPSTTASFVTRAQRSSSDVVTQCFSMLRDQRSGFTLTEFLLVKNCCTAKLNFFISKFQFCLKTGFMFLNKKLSLPFEIRWIPPPGWVWMISMSTDNGMKCMLTQTVM